MFKKTSLALAIFLLFTGFAYGQKITTITERFEGNEVSILVQIDTIETMDAMTSAPALRFEKSEKIEKLNGHNIYYDNWASEPVGGASQSDIRSFVIGLINEDLKRRNDVHNIDVVIDEEGKLAFIRFQFTRDGNAPGKETEPIRKKIIEKLKEIKFIPAKHNGKAVPYGFDIIPGKNITTITEKFEGNTVSIRVQEDTIRAECFIDGREYMIGRQETIQSLNGMDIYYDKEATPPVNAAGQNDFYNCLNSLAKEEAKSIEDVYSVNVRMDIIIDEKGDLGFLRFHFRYDEEDNETEKENYRQRVTKKMKDLHFVPAMRNGKAVPYGTIVSVNSNF